MPLGQWLNNPTHIERAPGVRWQGQSAVQKHDRFVTFDSAKWGIRAAARVLVTYQDRRQAADGSRIDTVREIIHRWAPPSDNNPTAAYAGNVAKLLRIGVDDTLDVYDWHTMRGLVLGIIRQELGRQPFDDATIDSGLIAAGIQAPVKETSTKEVAAASAGGVAGSAVVVVGAIKAIQETAAAASQAAEPLAVYGAWVVPVCAVIAVGALAFLAVRTKWLRKLVGNRP